MSQRKDAKAQRLDREALNDLSRLIITKGIEVHSKLGPGLLESVYRTCLAYELRKAGLHVQLDSGYRLDLLVAHEIIVEVKAVEKLLPVHLAQLLSYLRLADKRLGLLLNFNSTRLVHGLRRVVNNF